MSGFSIESLPDYGVNVKWKPASILAKRFRIYDTDQKKRLDLSRNFSLYEKPYSEIEKLLKLLQISHGYRRISKTLNPLRK